uniref:Uncharacterized protein n=1 Tax=Ralstonia syzygii R24 TaxID=907261 RepID=G3AC17_9RALS|nr:hypothetical protein RALSY_mp30406 [Ralstonia syzygii R24]
MRIFIDTLIRIFDAIQTEKI